MCTKRVCLLLVLGDLSLAELRRLYYDMKDTVFGQFVSYLCDTNALEKLLKEKFGTEKRMSSVKKPK